MRCPENERWGLYLDGELASADREQLENHLLSCLVCERLVLELRQEDDLISDALAAAPVPADLMTAINRRLNEDAYGGGFWINLILPILLMISTLLVLSHSWWTRLDWLWEGLTQLSYQSLLVDCLLFVVKTGMRLVHAALAGGPLFPTLAMLLVCVVWLRITIKKGGYAHV